MKTLLIHGPDAPPPGLRRIVEDGSTEVEAGRRDEASARAADRVVEWTGRELVVDGRRLRWPDDEDEIRMLFQTGG
jgi:hypothetical protein